MELTDMQSLLSAPPQVLAVICLMALGWLLKQQPKIKNEYIPAILAVSGIVVFCGLIGFSFNNAVIGFIVGTSATGSHQIQKQLLKPKPTDPTATPPPPPIAPTEPTTPTAPTL